MGIVSEYGVLKWNNANKKRYTELGYSFTKNGDEFLVKIEHLTKTTRATIIMECDYCGEQREITYKEYNNKLDKSIVKIDTCGSKECRNKKLEESSLIKYGVESPNSSDEVKQNKIKSIQNKYGKEYVSNFQLPSVKEKIIKTNIERYGTENPNELDYIKDKVIETNLERYGKEYYTQTDEYKEKTIKTNLNKYGVEWHSQSDIIKDKIVETNLSKYGVPYTLQVKEIRDKGIDTSIIKYGVPNYTQTEEFLARFKETSMKRYGTEYPSQSDYVKDKIKSTNLERYGYEVASKSPIVREKTRKTLFSKGSAPVSTQQVHIHKLIGGELNYPLSYYSLDIAFPDKMIYVEYDGGGHDLQVKFGKITEEEFQEKEIERQNFTYSLGWKVIRIISSRDYLPSDKIIVDFIRKAMSYLSSDEKWIVLDIDKETVRSSKYEKAVNLGRLKKLKKTS